MKSFGAGLAAGAVLLASVARAQTVCSIFCFQDVITEHPPLDCTDPDMYHCFCNRENLQGWFIECILEDCPDEVDESLAFGVGLCEDLGIPITIPPLPTGTTTVVESSTSEPTVPDPTSTDVEPTTEPTTEPTPEPTPEPTTTEPEEPAETTTMPEEPAETTSMSDEPTSESTTMHSEPSETESMPVESSEASVPGEPAETSMPSEPSGAPTTMSSETFSVTTSSTTAAPPVVTAGAAMVAVPGLVAAGVAMLAL